MGKTQTREMPRPTVRPIATEMSCSAVWKPESQVSDELWPASCLETKVNSPPFAKPEGSWNRIPVIYVDMRTLSKWEEEETYHNDKSVAFEEASIEI